MNFLILIKLLFIKNNLLQIKKLCFETVWINRFPINSTDECDIRYTNVIYEYEENLAIQFFVYMIFNSILMFKF